MLHFFIILVLFLRKITASVILLDCDEGVCPLVDAVVRCQVTDRGNETALQWLSLTMMPASIGVVSAVNPSREANGYTAMYIGNGLSTLSFIATTDRNTTVIQCLDLKDFDKQNCTVIIAGPPVSPTDLDYNITNTSVTLYWLPPASADCAVSYSIEIYTTARNDTITTDGNVTHLVTNLTHGPSEYKYRVAANNNITTGSYSTYSQPFTLDVPQPVSSIMATVINATDIGVYNIVIEWEPPPPSSRPLVLYYKVYHNITDLGTSCNMPSDTNITLSGAMAGEIYSITVIAVNVLGDGYSITTNVSIPALPSPQPSSSMTAIATGTTISTDTGITTIAQTPSTATTTSAISSTTTTTSPEQQNSSVPIIGGVVGGVVVAILIIVVVILVIVIVMSKRKQGFKESVAMSSRNLAGDNDMPSVESGYFLATHGDAGIPMYATPEVKTNTLKNAVCDIPPPIPPPLVDNDDDIPPPVPVYRGDMDILPSTAEYSEVALDHQTHHPHIITDPITEYSSLSRIEKEQQNISPAPPGLYSTLNTSHVHRNDPTRIVYADLGHNPTTTNTVSHEGERVIYCDLQAQQLPPPTPPTSHIVYDDVASAPPVPERPGRPPKRPPKPTQ